LGLLGRTGSGKTTLTRLLFRFYDPAAGLIRYGVEASSSSMVDIRRIPVPELRRRVGLVTQNIQLFHASVRDNLTFFDPSISDEKILDAIENLDLGNWLRSLPDGLDSELTSGAGGLSAGQAQLLAFVRIFLRDPGLVVLDEASSRLDPATETMIERAISQLIENRTAIVIAHRLDTVERADEIIILENGRILEKGVRKELLRDPHTHLSNLMRTGLQEVLV
jgi:ATP-binding cassette subfamily B protein